MEYLCKKCGKVIIPGRTSKGKLINFDGGQIGYLKMDTDEKGIIADPEEDVFFDHDKICPNKDASLEESFGENGG